METYHSHYDEKLRREIKRLRDNLKQQRKLYIQLDEKLKQRQIIAKQPWEK